MRRLIEADLPIGVISQHARRDQNVKKGHLHTLHVWWATRPLAACRAVLMATLLPDPADEACPEAFRREARAALAAFSNRDLSQPSALRQALLEFIGHFAAWENAVHPLFVQTARRLVAAAHPDGPPLVADPFAGMGSIPFEALRIGADAFAMDYNPVATLLLKTALEYLPTYGEKLAQAVRQWGQWVRERAAEELRPFYPPDPDGSIPLAYLWARTIRCEGPGCGVEVPLVGLLWLSRKEKQRVALRYYPSPARGGVAFDIFHPRSEHEVQPPIVRRFAATCPVCGYTTPYKQVREQLRAKRGGTRDARLIAVITLKPDGSRGFRIATERDVEVARRAEEALELAQARYSGPLPLVPDEPTPESRGPGASRAFSVQKYGMETWGDLFTLRQALALSTFVRLVREAYDALTSSPQLPSPLPTSGEGKGEAAPAAGGSGEGPDTRFARAVATCLALAVSQLSHYLSSISFYWKEGMISAFIQGSGLPMRPDFAEANPLMAKLVGGFEYALEQVVQVLEREGEQGLHAATVRQGSTTAIPLPDQSVPYVVTDPPYYDAVPYAALSDFCYVWLKRMLSDLYPDLLRWLLTPKAEECILDPGPPPPGEPEKTKEFFEGTMERALAECRRVLQPGGLAVVLFAHKGTAGWEALLNALVRAGWTVTASWPIETERAARMRAKNSAVLASSVFLVCRPRAENAGVGEWRQVLAELNERVAQWLPRLAQEGIQGADAIFSCLGPALEVYSRYERVETAAGQAVPLADVRDGVGAQGRAPVQQRGYLSYVWEAVSREALKVIFPEAEPSGFEEDARFTAMWLWTLRARADGVPAEAEEALEGMEDEEGGERKAPPTRALPYDDARLLIQGLGVREEQLKRPGGVLEVKGDKARLLSVAERRRFLLGGVKPAQRPTVRGEVVQLALEALQAGPAPEPSVALQPGATTLDRLHQAMLLFADNRSEALRWLLVDAGAGREERFWRLANALSALYPPNSAEKRWVDGLLARRKGLGL